MRVLFLGPADALAHVREFLPGATVAHAVDEGAADAALPSSEVVLDALMRVRFPAERLARAPGLALYVTATTGADHVDAHALAARGIPLLTLRGQREVLRNVTPAAEHSWLLLMACARQLRGAMEHVLEGGWDRNMFPGLMLRGRVLGLVGCGRIGEWMSRYGAAFGMRCIGYDPHAQPWPATIERVSLDELLREADVVSVHVPLNEQTRRLLGADAIARMRRGVIIVNTSRGEVLDEAALLDGLVSGHVGAAGLDVLTGEPETAEHPLVRYARGHENLVVTPHIGGFSPDALRFVLEFSCGRIRDHFAGAAS